MKYSIDAVKHLLLITSLALTACSSGSNDTLPKYRTVEGAVVKAPVSNATIDIFEVDRAGQAIPPPIATVTSDSNGAFSIPNLPQGAYLARSRGGQFTDESDPSGERVVTLTQSQGFETLIPVGATTATITPFTQILVDKLRRQAVADDVPFESLIEGGRNVFKAAFGFDILTTIPSNPIAPQPGVAKPTLTPELNYAMALGGFAQAINAIALDLKSTATSFEIIQQYINDLSDGLENGAADSVLNVAGAPLPVAHINEEINRFRNNNDEAYSDIPPFVIQLLRIADPAERDPNIVDPTPSPSATPEVTPTSTPTPLATPTPTSLATPTPTPPATPPPTPPATPIPNIAPTANDSSVTTDENQPVTGQLQASDGNGDALAFTVISPPNNGSLNVTSATGSFTYTPTKYFDGSDSFSFRANDDSANSNTATVTLNVLDKIAPFHFVEFGTGYSSASTTGAASFVNSASVTVAELSGSGSAILLSDDDATTAEDRLLTDNSLSTTDGVNYMTDDSDDLTASTRKSVAPPSKVLHSRNGDENNFGILSIRDLFNEGVAGPSAFYDWPTTQRLFPGSVGQYSGTAFFQAEDYPSLNGALHSNFKQAEIIRGENALDLMIPFSSSADSTPLSGSYGLVKFEVRFSTDGSGQSYIQTEMLDLPLTSNSANGTATIITATDITRNPANNGSQIDNVSTKPERLFGPDSIGKYQFSTAANGALQIDFDKDGDGAIQTATGEISALGAIDPTQQFFAAAFANNPQTMGILAGVKRYSGTLIASDMQNRKFVIHGLENLFATTYLESSTALLRHGSLEFSTDGTTANLLSSQGDESKLTRYDDTENYSLDTYPYPGFDSSNGNVTFGTHGDITINLGSRVLHGFISDDLQSLVFSSSWDDGYSLGTGLFIGSQANACRDSSGCNLDNLAPYPQIDQEYPEYLGGSQASTYDKANVISTPIEGFGGEDDTLTILNNGETIDLSARFGDDDTAAPIAVRWTSTAGSFGTVDNQADSTYLTLSSTSWSAPGSGSGRTYLTAIGSDGDFEAVYRKEVAWGLDGDDDGLLDDEETQIYGTDKTQADSDGDNLKDGYEVATFSSDPLDIDSDDDDVNDGFEDRYNTSPNSKNDVAHVDQALSGGCTNYVELSDNGARWDNAYCGQTEVEALLGERQSQSVYTPLYILYNAGEYRGLALDNAEKVYAIGSLGPNDLIPRDTDTHFRGSGASAGKASGCPAAAAGNCSVVTMSSSNDLGLSNIRLFDGSNPEERGGGLYINTSFSIQLDNLLIDNNVASYGGGLAISGNSNDIHLRNSEIFNNQAVPDSTGGFAGRGGGVYSLGENLVVQNSKISSNQATTEDALASDSNAHGGGIYLQHSGSGSGYDSTRIEHSEIEYNTAHGHGGGVYLDTPGPSCVTMKENNVRGNRVEFAGSSVAINTGASGGGIWWGSETDCSSSFTDEAGTLFANAITANFAEDSGVLQGGGGIYAATGTKILHNTIVGNTTDGQGGGVLLTSSQTTAGTQQLFNNLVASNYALGNGGGVAFLDQYDSSSNAHTLESNSIVSNATGGFGAGLYIHPIDDDAVSLFEQLSLFDNLITFNTAAGTAPSTDNVECRITDENNSSATTDCCNGTSCSGPIAVMTMSANAFGDNADEIPAAASDSLNQVKPGSVLTGYTTFSNPFLVGGFRLDQTNSSLIDMAAGSTPDCASNFDCSTNTSGAADIGTRDIGMHFKDPAAQPVVDVVMDGGVFGGSTGNASDCAQVGFELKVAGGHSAGAKHLVSVQIDGGSASPGAVSLFVKDDFVATPPPEAPNGAVMANNLGNGDFEAYICTTDNISFETVFSNVQITIQIDERSGSELISKTISLRLYNPS